MPVLKNLVKYLTSLGIFYFVISCKHSVIYDLNCKIHKLLQGSFPISLDFIKRRAQTIGCELMKKYLLILIAFITIPAWAGRMKEVYIMTQESVLNTLGYDETVAVVEDLKFVKIENVDLSVQSTVRVTSSVFEKAPAYSCITLFEKTSDLFQVIKSQCREI